MTRGSHLKNKKRSISLFVITLILLIPLGCGKKEAQQGVLIDDVQPPERNGRSFVYSRERFQAAQGAGTVSDLCGDGVAILHYQKTGKLKQKFYGGCGGDVDPYAEQIGPELAKGWRDLVREKSSQALLKQVLKYQRKRHSFPDSTLELAGSEMEAETTAASYAEPEAKYPLSSVPLLNSKPDALAILYLDFDGHYAAVWGDHEEVTTPPFDLDDDESTFSESELDAIRKIWQLVAEDYAPFNINVTTVEPPSFANGEALRVAIGGYGGWGSYNGGVAYVNSFSNSSTNTVYVFSSYLQHLQFIGDVASHESGHGFGLQHQQESSLNDHTPIMTGASTAARSVWWEGINSNDRYQDDMAVISSSRNEFGYRLDDHGAELYSATALIPHGKFSERGIIETLSDRDAFSFSLSEETQLTVWVTTPQYWEGKFLRIVGNLDARIELRDQDGNLMASDNSTVSFGGYLRRTLLPGTYFLIVASHGLYGDVGQYFLTGELVRTPDVLVAPTGLSATALSTSEVQLNWTDNATNETGYRIDRSTDGVNWTTIANIGANGTSFSNANLAAGTKYYYRVYAISSVTISDASNTASATTLPPAPTNLTATAVSSTQINLSWGDVEGESGYKVERSTNGTNWGQIATTGGTSYQSKYLFAGITYYYRVRAYNSGGNSAYSNLTSAKTIAHTSAPIAPSNLVVVGTLSTAVSLSWTDNSTNEDGFKIETSFDGITWATSSTLLLNVTSSAQYSLLAATLYYFRVRAYNNIGSSVSNVVTTTTLSIASPPASSNLFASAVDSNAVNLSWSNVSTESGFSIERSYDQVTWSQIATVKADTTTYQASATLLKVYFRIRAYNADGYSAYSNVVEITLLRATGLYATALSDRQIDLTFSDIDFEDSYSIERSLDGVNWNVLNSLTHSGTLDDITYSDVGLTQNTRYFYRVRAHNSSGWSGYSNIEQETTLAILAPTGAPSNLQSIAVSEDQINLQWSDTVDGEWGFRIERSLDELTWSQIAVLGPIEPRGSAYPYGTPYPNTGLNPGTTYFYRVRAYNNAGYSAYSNVSSATTLGTGSLPNAPELVATASSGNNRIDLSWSDHSANEDGFKIERSLDSSAWTQIATAPANTTYYYNGGLTAGTTYYYRVFAYNAAGSSSSNIAQATTGGTSPPLAPSNLMAVARSTSQIDLQWTDNSSNESGFRVERSLDGLTFAQIATTGSNITTYSSTILTASTRYYFRVRAYNGGGSSAYSSTTSAVTFDTTEITVPSNLSATATSSTQVYLSWSDNSNNESGFRIERSLDGVSFTQIGSVAMNITSYADSGLTASTKYYYRARAYNGAGNSSYTNTASATTQAPPTSEPTPDTIAPTVSITSPANGSTVARRSSLTVSANASDNVGVARVEFYVNGSLACTGSIAPYSCTWSVPGGKAGKTYQIQAKAFDAAGNVGSSAIISVRSQ